MSKLTPPIGPGDHLLGDSEARVTLVEYGDYQCTYCGRAHLIVKEVLRRLGPETRFVFRHFPLAPIHPDALPAAEAAEAAGAQGKFWRMHAALFENQNALEAPYLLGYAQTLGLDMARFAREFAGHTHLDKVEADLRSGARSGVQGTPAFFIDGVRHDGGWDARTLLDALHAAFRAKAA